ncbi:hypothetical protein ABB55_01385 [Prosthecomicrobium hirschii]|uniref:Glycosyl transferase family 1 domain-containing protein n=1 Tax=Prosthecodimorpha hirschii TaxID=665126 RepID=A0A0P6VGD1_9HYPH|nr:glycosyltransferase [Prosthecomicrobium hirschii]KPL51038.1 hypothetical protein ABB55_01385 [Prosthecomicrobium hirschii]
MTSAAPATIPARKPLILHISSDYPNPIRTPTTNAVERLVDRMTDHPQVVVSLQRVGLPWQTYWRDLGMVGGRRLIAHGYFALPLGVGMLAWQWRLARRIRRFLAAERIAPEIVHSHRFTFEGIAAWMVARATGAALFQSVRGEVEQKVFRLKPTYRPLFRRMARDAARIFYVSAWYRAGFERHTGADPARTRLLPNIVLNARPEIAPALPDPRIVVALRLDALDRKGLPDLIAAFAAAGPALDGFSLDIVGDAPADSPDRDRVHGLIAAHGLEGRAHLRGPVGHENFLADLPRALVLAMPSRDETFGMVYPEALFSGVPILYAAGTGIDGYLDGLEVGIGVRPGDVAGIADALVRLVRDNARYRAAIRAAAPTLFERLSPEGVVARYRAEIDAATAPATGRRRGA